MAKIFASRRAKQDWEDSKEWPTHIVTLDKKIFSDFVKNYRLTVVDFWAPWCAPCKAVLPKLRLLSKRYAGRVAFGRLNIEKNKDIAKRYRVKSIPNLLFFCRGKKISSLLGVRTTGDLMKKIDNALAKCGT